MTISQALSQLSQHELEPAIRGRNPGMTNIFADFRRLVVAALDDLSAKGEFPRGLDLRRVAVELPRDPAHGDLSTNAAMVLAGAVKQNPMVLAEHIAPAMMARELETG